MFGSKGQQNTIQLPLSAPPEQKIVFRDVMFVLKSYRHFGSTGGEGSRERCQLYHMDIPRYRINNW
jgi:hypothetical protein